jgi:hypothetical protein
MIGYRPGDAAQLTDDRVQLRRRRFGSLLSGVRLLHSNSGRLRQFGAEHFDPFDDWRRREHAGTYAGRRGGSDLLRELLIDHGDVALRLIGIRCVAPVRRWNRVLGGCRIRGLA